ncbi:MAG: hypothetical protein KF824_09665 [Fimbriimonadaceae bacterium]|nr:MAG: hypothetical protein KF824_09665 [Fimbriimonadaceae bacterium]
MDIRDYESGRSLNDVDIVLTRDEAEELSAYLGRLLTNPGLKTVQLTRLEGMTIASELSVTLNQDSLQPTPSRLLRF